jgi:hypothetical protein
MPFLGLSLSLSVLALRDGAMATTKHRAAVVLLFVILASACLDLSQRFFVSNFLILVCDIIESMLRQFSMTTPAADDYRFSHLKVDAKQCQTGKQIGIARTFGIGRACV